MNNKINTNVISNGKCDNTRSNSIDSDCLEWEDRYEHYELFQDCIVELKEKFERKAIDNLRSYYEEGDPNNEFDVFATRIITTYYPQKPSNGMSFLQNNSSMDISECKMGEDKIFDGNCLTKEEGKKVAKLYELFSNSKDQMDEWSKKIMETYYPQYSEKTKKAPSLFEQLKDNDKLGGDMDQSFECLLNKGEEEVSKEVEVDANHGSCCNKEINEVVVISDLLHEKNMQIMRWKSEDNMVFGSNELGQSVEDKKFNNNNKVMSLLSIVICLIALLMHLGHFEISIIFE